MSKRPSAMRMGAFHLMLFFLSVLLILSSCLLRMNLCRGAFSFPFLESWTAAACVLIVRSDPGATAALPRPATTKGVP